MNTINDVLIASCFLLSPFFIVIISMVIIKKRNPSAVIFDKTKIQQPQAIAGLIMAILLPAIIIWAMFYELHEEEIRSKEVAARPHTARILGYQVSFPKKMPVHYDGGNIEMAYFYDSEGKEGRTRVAEWEISPPQGNFEDGMQFMVNELSTPGNMPSIWQTPPYWEKVVRTPAGTKEIGGLKFAITKWTADYTGVGACKLSGVDYFAQDAGKLIGLRAVDSKDRNTTTLLADSVINTFQKTKMPKPDPKIKDSLGRSADGSVCIVHGGNDGTFKDPYAELIQP